MTRLYILTLCSVLIALIIFLNKRRKTSTIAAGTGQIVKEEWLVPNPDPITFKSDCRPADQTFLTYPEWFLVHSPSEQADYFRHHTSSTFPFMSHVDQIWKSYRIMYDQIKGSFKFNTGYHVMTWVIGASTTVEYSIRALYETIIGRLTDTGGKVMTEEDQFNARYMQEYVDFIRVTPWYAFDFKKRFVSLWRETSFFGPHFLRKLDRKFILSSELLGKAIYGWIIGLGTKTAYEEALPTTTVVVDYFPEEYAGEMPQIKFIQKVQDGSVILSLPRYAAFKPNAILLASKGVTFKEIAGNNSAILITALASEGWKPASDHYQYIFTQLILTKPGLARFALVTPVPSLGKTLTELKDKGIEIEHIYDF